MFDAANDLISNGAIAMPLDPANTARSAQPTEPLIRPFMPELDMLRGIAVLGVMLLHAFYWSYAGMSFGPWARRFVSATQPGWMGVNLFFVLSGFLITGILLDSKDKPYFYRRFYTRRALRILPPYYLLLIVLLLMRSSSVAFVGLSFVYLANMTDFFGVVCDYGPLWSLAVEEHFYILWPTVVHKVTARRLAIISAAIVIVTPGLRATSFALGHRSGLDWYTWFVADGLAAGSLIAIVLRTRISRKQVWTLCSMLMASAAVLVAVGRPFGITTRNRLLGAGLQYTLITLVCAGILLMFLLAGTSRAKSFVNVSPLRFLGYISYGLYLNHFLAFRVYDLMCRRYFPSLLPSSGHFALVLLKFALAGGGAIVVAYVSRKYYEERFLRLKDSLVPKASEFDAKSAAATSPQAA
jgi:peptidoglycan/LPS O-acetylase OafA/YrhL